MFDPSKYVPDLAGLAGQGNELMARSAMANTQNMSRDFGVMAEIQAQKRRDKMQLQAEMAKIAQRQEAVRSLEQRFGQNLAFRQQKAAQDQANVLYERGERQRATDADLVAGLVGPMASGNLNALERERTQAMMRDPSLSVRLPGEKGPTPEPVPGIPNVDDVYPEDTGRLRVMRGSQPVYVSPEANVMRGREAAVADLLGPNAGPWSARAVEAAGAGVTGEKAAEIARMEQNKLEGRETAERVAGQRLGQQRALAGERRDYEQPIELHKLVLQMAAPKVEQVKKINAQDQQMALAENQLASADPLEQRRAIAGVQRAYSGLAQTNSERRDLTESAGMTEAFLATINKWVDGGELPADFKRQMANMIQHARVESNRQKTELGKEAKEGVYAARGLPFRTARELAEYGNQAFQAVAGVGLSEEQIDREARWLEQRYPGRFGGRSAAPMPAGGALPSEGLPDDAFIPPNDMGDMGGFAGGSGARDSLGTMGAGPPSRQPFSAQAIGRTPPIPLQPPDAEDAIDRELEDEALRMLGGE